MGDYIFIFKKGWPTDRPFRKLNNQHSKSWKIVVKKGHSYELNLLKHWEKHKVFAPKKLKRAQNNLLLKQRNDPEPLIKIKNNLEWEVNEILASKIHRKNL